MLGIFLKILNMSISATWLVLAIVLLRLIWRKAPRWSYVLLWSIVGVRLMMPFSIESKWSLMPDTETIYYEGARDSEISGMEPLSIGIVVWLMGLMVMFFYYIFSYVCLRKRMATAVRIRENVFQSENVSMAFVLGIIKPRVYIPYGMDVDSMEHVIAHEKSHIARRDYWWKPLGFFVLSVYWFNPFIWLAYLLLCRDIELACDERVIKTLANEQRADYSSVLLDCSISRGHITACPLAFGEVGVKERIKFVKKYKKPTILISTISLLICLVMAVCFLTNPVEKKEETEVAKMETQINTVEPEKETFKEFELTQAQKEELRKQYEEHMQKVQVEMEMQLELIREQMMKEVWELEKPFVSEV